MYWREAVKMLPVCDGGPERVFWGSFGLLLHTLTSVILLAGHDLVVMVTHPSKPLNDRSLRRNPLRLDLEHRRDECHARGVYYLFVVL
jgi:hypothetical protein